MAYLLGSGVPQGVPSSFKKKKKNLNSIPTHAKQSLYMVSPFWDANSLSTFVAIQKSFSMVFLNASYARDFASTITFAAAFMVVL